MNIPILALLTLVAAAAIGLAIFLGGLLVVPVRAALRLAGAAMIGGAIGFAGTALGMAPLHPQALSSGPGAYTYFGLALLAGLAGGLLCATMIFRLSRIKN
jgi:hypothetical protein